MKTFIDQDGCTACGLCADDVPELFFMWNKGRMSDGLAYVKNASDKTGLNSSDEPKMKGVCGMAVIPDRLLSDVIDISEECPGECLYITDEQDC